MNDKIKTNVNRKNRTRNILFERLCKEGVMKWHETNHKSFDHESYKWIYKEEEKNDETKPKWNGNSQPKYPDSL